MAIGETIRRTVQIPAGKAFLSGDLVLPPGTPGIVLFAHGSGSSRLSPRNRFVAARINDAGIGTLLFDLLTIDEEAIDVRTRHLRFDIPLLTGRLAEAVRWVRKQYPELLVGLFGSSTGAAAALSCAADHPRDVSAIVSRGGRPDLAGDALVSLSMPVLLIVGEFDEPVIRLNRQARRMLGSSCELRIVAGATHLFEEPGTLDDVAEMAGAWFRAKLSTVTAPVIPNTATDRPDRAP